MNPFLEMAKASRIILTSGIESGPQSFKTLSGEKLQVYLKKIGPMTENMYEFVAMEPAVIDRFGDEKVTWELNIVSAKNLQQLLSASSCSTVPLKLCPASQVFRNVSIG